jgi:hypothetical protein
MSGRNHHSVPCKIPSLPEAARISFGYNFTFIHPKRALKLNIFHVYETGLKLISNVLVTSLFFMMTNRTMTGFPRCYQTKVCVILRMTIPSCGTLLQWWFRNVSQNCYNLKYPSWHRFHTGKPHLYYLNHMATLNNFHINKLLTHTNSLFSMLNFFLSAVRTHSFHTT